VKGRWKLADLPSKNWQSIRFDYWKDNHFILGDFQSLTKFMGSSGGDITLSLGNESRMEVADV
jgi:hypothetical protein